MPNNSHAFLGRTKPTISDKSFLIFRARSGTTRKNLIFMKEYIFFIKHTPVMRVVKDYYVTIERTVTDNAIILLLLFLLFLAIAFPGVLISLFCKSGVVVSLGARAFADFFVKKSFGVAVLIPVLIKLFFFLGGTSLIMEMNPFDSWGDYIKTSAKGTSSPSADAGPVPQHGNTISNSTEGPASPGRFPYEPDELIGGDSVLSIQRRLLSSKPFPSAEEIDFARTQAEDLFEVKVQIIQRMQVLDPTGDWMRQGARAFDSPNSATGESPLKRLYSFLDELDRDGKSSRAFFSLSEKVALRKDNLDAGSSA
ncbi:hypothetical protein Hanom_Chr00s096674g01801661 [Helianthus anomalus]